MLVFLHLLGAQRGKTWSYVEFSVELLNEVVVVDCEYPPRLQPSQPFSQVDVVLLREPLPVAGGLKVRRVQEHEAVTAVPRLQHLPEVITLHHHALQAAADLRQLLDAFGLPGDPAYRPPRVQAARELAAQHIVVSGGLLYGVAGRHPVSEVPSPLLVYVPAVGEPLQPFLNFLRVVPYLHEEVNQIPVYVVIDLLTAPRLGQQQLRAASEDLHVPGVGRYGFEEGRDHGCLGSEIREKSAQRGIETFYRCLGSLNLTHIGRPGKAETTEFATYG